MTLNRGGWLGIVVALMVLTIRVDAAPVDEAIAIEKKAFEARLSIKAYDVTVKFDHGANNISGNTCISARYYFDGENLRYDHVVKYGKQERFDGLNEDSYRTVDIYRPDKHLNFSFKKMPPPGQRVVEIDAMPTSVPDKYKTARIERSLLSLGFHPGGLFPNLPMDEMLVNLSTPGRTVEDEVIGGIQCKKISLKLTTGVDCSVWIAPSQGYSIIKCRSQYDKFDMTNEITLKVEEWQSSGLWFPVHYKSIGRVNRKLTQYTVALIEVNSLNKQIPSETFQIKGIGVPVGRTVMTLPSSGPKELWDGEKVVRKGSRPVVQHEKVTVSWFMAVNGIFAALLCVFFILRLRKS